jgi:hypothetical protein
MALSSASLLSPSYQIDINAYNTIRNAVLLGEVYNPMSFIPSFNTDLLRYTYHQIENQPDMSVEYFASRSGFRFFFYKNSGRVYHVVSNEEVTEIYQVRETVGSFGYMGEW